MLVEIRQSGSEQLLDRVELDAPPSPGRWFVHDDSSFLVMQSRHRYRLHSGHYRLSSVVLMVKTQKHCILSQKLTLLMPQDFSKFG